MYKYLIIPTYFVVFFALSRASAQTANRVDFNTPSTADFVKYGNVSPTLYNGQSGLSIPLVHGKDKKFDIPIIINYNSNGFMPGRPSGPEGLDWYLSTGGAITRKVNGTADDNQGQDEGCPTCSTRVIKGFWAGVQSNPINQSTAFNFQYGSVDPQIIWNMGYDYEPDEFSFNFMGYSGKFFISNDGYVRVISKDYLLVDLTSFALQPVQMNKVLPHASTIVVTTPNGYKYYFGGAPQNLEYSFPLYGNGGASASNQAVIHTWNLTKIVSPSGSEANFTYVAHDPSILNTDAQAGETAYPASANNSFILNQYVNASIISNNITTGSQYGLQGSSSSSMFSQDPSYSVTKTCYLAKISTDNFTIDFSYSPKLNKFYNNSNIYNQFNLQLDNIALKTKDNIVKQQFNFNYTYLGTNSRHFLTSLQELGKPAYAFDYYSTASLPAPEARGIDHWGFWNGGTSTTSLLIPSVSWDASGNETITSAERNSSATYCQVGLLKKVTYPTGGYSMFEYEGNNYSNRLERTSASAFLPAIVNISGNAGGARVSKIYDFDGLSTVNVKEYKYVKGFLSNPAGTASSGFLLDYPRYGYYLTFGSGSQMQVFLQLKSSSFHSNYNTSENFISYSEVTEINNENGYKVYKFSDYTSNPDIADYNQKDLSPTISNSASNLNLYKNFVGYKLGDRSRDRGKLVFTGIYDNNKQLIQSAEASYDVFNAATSAYSTAILAGSGSFAQSYKIYYDRPLVIKTKESVAGSASNRIETQTLYDYDSTYRALIQQTYTDSKGDERKTTYNHPYDFLSTPPYLYMINRNIIDPIIETRNFVRGNQTVFSRVNYANFSNNYWPAYIQEQIAGNPVRTILSFNQYDSFGNIREQQKTDAPADVYLWGYNSQYPVAKVTGSTYTAVSALIDQTILDNLATTDVQMRAELNKLRSLSNALVSTFTYLPLVGMTSSTDAKGQTTYYEYDGFQRLINIKDKDGNIIKHTDYHYQGQ